MSTIIVVGAPNQIHVMAAIVGDHFYCLAWQCCSAQLTNDIVYAYQPVLRGIIVRISVREFKVCKLMLTNDFRFRLNDLKGKRR